MPAQPIALGLDQRIEHRHPSPGGDGYLATGIDWSTGTIHSLARGFWAIDQVDRFFVDYRRLVRLVQQRCGTARVLVDMREAPPQSPQVAARVQQGADRLYGEGDRVAMVVSTSLAKMQMRRVLDPRVHGFFISLSAAEMWLAAWGQPGAQPGSRTRS